MNTDIQIFNNSEFGQIRTAGTPDNPLFCLTDVCKALALDPKYVVRRLERGVVSKHPLSSKGGRQLGNFVNEDGLYDVIFDSRKPEARKFRKWVTGEVLPSIRKTGSYGTAGDRQALLEAEHYAQGRELQHYRNMVSCLSREKYFMLDIGTQGESRVYNRLAQNKLLSTSEIASCFGHPAYIFYERLASAGVVRRRAEGGWELSDSYRGYGLCFERVGVFDGMERGYLLWTRKGSEFLMMLRRLAWSDADKAVETINAIGPFDYDEYNNTPICIR